MKRYQSINEGRMNKSVKKYIFITSDLDLSKSKLKLTQCYRTTLGIWLPNMTKVDYCMKIIITIGDLDPRNLKLQTKLEDCPRYVPS
jgi:hypothetical protein